MAGFSKIEWTDSTFNPWVGCTKIKRPGNKPSACDFCYAEKWAKRSGQVRWGSHPRRRTTDVYWQSPLKWNSQASDFYRKFGRRRRVFCASLADVFDNQADVEWRTDLFELIRQCDQIDWQLLTKRPQNIKKMLPSNWGTGYPNVWLGTTAEDAASYQERVSHLLTLPAVVKFVSYEPALGPLGKVEVGGATPDWIIIGGESGVRADLARPTQPQWARDAIEECRRHKVAPFLKQWGSYSNNPLVVEQGWTIKEAMEMDPPENGKGGGKLDDKIWREFPRARNSVGAKKGSASSQNAVERRELLPG